MEEQCFALLIDAENVSVKYIKPVLTELSKYGVITYKRIYGDWTSTQLSGWKEQLLSNSITPILCMNCGAARQMPSGRKRRPPWVRAASHLLWKRGASDASGYKRRTGRRHKPPACLPCEISRGNRQIQKRSEGCSWMTSKKGLSKWT